MMLKQQIRLKKLMLSLCVASLGLPASAFNWPELDFSCVRTAAAQALVTSKKFVYRHAQKLGAAAVAGLAYAKRDDLAERWERATATRTGTIGAYAAVGAALLGVGYYVSRQVQRAREFAFLERHYINSFAQGLEARELAKLDTYFPWGAWGQSPVNGTLGLRRAAAHWESAEA